ncbi:F-box protein AUF1-like [Coffea arabica]|uniref:F-box protein AUF1-like n=1 Tax=Coffea arabica TaxID=13443 RepID=A0ABM4W8Z4_COFAR
MHLLLLLLIVKHPAYGFDQSNGFDSIPNPIVLHFFNKISDIKTLIRCRSVSKRFNSLHTHFGSPTRTQNSPTQILRRFENIRSLQIELPSGDLRLEKGTTMIGV